MKRILKVFLSLYLCAPLLSQAEENLISGPAITGKTLIIIDDTNSKPDEYKVDLNVAGLKYSGSVYRSSKNRKSLSEYAFKISTPSDVITFKADESVEYREPKIRVIRPAVTPNDGRSYTRIMNVGSKAEVISFDRSPLLGDLRKSRVGTAEVVKGGIAFDGESQAWYFNDILIQSVRDDGSYAFDRLTGTVRYVTDRDRVRELAADASGFYELNVKFNEPESTASAISLQDLMATPKTEFMGGQIVFRALDKMADVTLTEAEFRVMANGLSANQIKSFFKLWLRILPFTCEP